MLAVWYPTELLQPSPTSWTVGFLLVALLIGFVAGYATRRHS